MIHGSDGVGRGSGPIEICQELVPSSELDYVADRGAHSSLDPQGDLENEGSMGGGGLKCGGYNSVGIKGGKKTTPFFISLINQ